MLKIAYHPIYKYPLPEGHRFPMEKYDLLQQQLVYEGTCSEENFFEPSLPLEKYILQVHTEEYVNNLKKLTLPKKEARKIGFPLSEKLITRGQIIADGTMKGCEFALNNGIAMNIAGGTHHSYTDHGEGFCIFNDQAIAARYLQSKGLAKKVLIVDLDVHQGDGTASIFEHQDSVFTISFHGQKNYPFKKQNSDFDLPFGDNTDDRTYLNALENHLPRLVDLVEPDFMFYLAGVDVLKTDKLGRLGLSMAGCKARDRFVLTLCKDQNIPVQVSMGGGYSVHLKNIIDAHSNTFELAQELFF